MTRTPLTPERWARVQEVFEAALGADESLRVGVVEAACAEDGSLRDEVLSLLEAHDKGGMIGEPARSESTPGQFGAYRIIRALGQGGMGTVYLAERSGEGFTQSVALKVLRPGTIDQRIAERLAGERRILARLEHPGIGRFIDGGTTDTGSPYIAMEYIEGTDLITYCNSRSLRVRERLELFVQVCDAVQYAHQQLVIHRDIKPGNIMVTTDQRPKLLDFGIAKILEPTTDGAMTTLPWFTPAYASPEQVMGKQVGTASDVYSLGVVLYELLTGQRPYDIDIPTPLVIQRVVCEEMPARPSSRVTTSARRALKGDLDTIVLRALAKEPERRYPTAERLAEDVRRHLDGRPVTARPDRLAYTTGKFVRRHPAAAALAVLLSTSLVIHGYTVGQKNRRIEAAFNEARFAAANSSELTDFLLGVFEPRGEDARSDSLLLGRLVARGEERARQVAENPAAATLSLSAMGRVYRHLGRYDDAAATLERALASAQARHGDDHLEVAEIKWNLADAYRLAGKPEPVESLLTSAFDIMRARLGDDNPRVATVLNQLALTQRDAGRLDEAERNARQGLAIRRRALVEDPTDIAASLGVLGSILRRKGELEAAEPMYREVLERKRRDFQGDHSDVAIALSNLGVLQSDMGDYSAAEANQREALGIHRRVLGEEHPFVTTGMTNLGQTLTRAGKLEEAESLIREALEKRRRTLGNEHPNVAVDLHNLGMMLKAAGRKDEAQQVLKQALDLRVKSLGENHPLTKETASELRTLDESAEAQLSSLHQRRDDRRRITYVSRSRLSGAGSCSRPPLPAEPNFGAVNPFVV